MEQQYQPADQIALYWTQLRSRQQGELGDEVERFVWLAYPNTKGDIADNLACVSFVALIGDGELQRWVHQAARLICGSLSCRAARGGFLS